MFSNEETFLPLYKTLVRSHFDYAMIVWNPHLVKHIESIESVQRRATKMIPEIKNFTYPERLKIFNLPSLAYRRIRGDMIEIYKIVNEIYDYRTTQKLLNYRNKKHVNLRGHQYTLDHKRLYSSVKIHFFANRVVNIWNSLPDVVIGAGNVNIFNLLKIH